MALLRRYYIEKGLFFEVFDDGLVVMYVFGNEIVRQKLRPGVTNTEIRKAFGTTLYSYGVGIDPAMKMAELEKKVEKLSKEMKALKKRK